MPFKLTYTRGISKMYHESNECFEPDEESNSEYSDQIDSLDCSIFTGELLYTNINEFEWHVDRWKREIERHKKLKDENT